MKFGPCAVCLIGPICSTLCDDKMDDLTRHSAVRESKLYQDVSIKDFIRQLELEGMEIKKIGVVDAIPKSM